MRRLLFIFLLLFSLNVFADTFYCPMKCEGEKTYEVKGTCPVCGMNLEKKPEGEAARPLNTRDYRMELTMLPAAPKAGEKTVLTLTPRRTKDNSVVKELDIVHEKPLHLILVSQELDWFGHEHPEVQPDGSLKLDFTFPRAGNFLLFADLTPKGDRNQVFPIAVQIAGTKPKIPDLKVSGKGPKKFGTYSVTFAVQPKAIAEKPVSLVFKLTQNGKPVKDLQPYLGTLGHVVGVSEDTTQYIHAHPPGHAHGGGHHDAGHAAAAALPTGGPDVTFMTTFPRPGLYKVWGQFLHQGKILVADFVVSVKEKE